MENANEGGGGPDPRFEFMGSYVIKTLKLKPEKWIRVQTFEEHKAMIKEFLDKPLPSVLVILLTPAAQLVPTTVFPLTQLKTKGVYFIKKLALEVPLEKCEEWLILGDLATRTIDQLSSLVDEVFVPLLSNPYNHKGWPEMVSQDVLKHVHSLKSTVCQVKGQVSGQTVLPMPVGMEKVYEAARMIAEDPTAQVDLYMKSAIEGVVIKWATQINDVMEENPASAFNNNANPLPTVELNFWNNRMKNFSFIFEQLRELRVQCMAKILQQSESAYYPCFKTLFKNVVTGTDWISGGYQKEMISVLRKRRRFGNSMDLGLVCRNSF